jgi:mRNA-degrading endonuclease toxin of MazEF toxin-antitoxin module
VVKGSLVGVSLDPARGAEVPKTRRCIIVSRTEANDVSSTVTIVPLSSVTGRAADRLVQPLLSAKDTRLSKDSRALCDQVRSIGVSYCIWNSRVMSRCRRPQVGFAGSDEIKNILRPQFPAHGEPVEPLNDWNVWNGCFSDRPDHDHESRTRSHQNVDILVELW